MLEDREVERALVVMAHPDDVDFGCAGTLALWTDAGVEVTYLILTDGDAGGNHGPDDGDLAAARRAEQLAAARITGVRDVRFLGRPDGRLTPDLDLRRDITRTIRQVRPLRMLIPSPDRDWKAIIPSHPDHLAAGEAGINAVYPDARNPHAHPELRAEGLDPWTVPEVWLVNGLDPDHARDITEVFDRKMAALSSHASQIADMAALRTQMRDYHAAQAARAGLRGRLAELYQIVDTS